MSEYTLQWSVWRTLEVVLVVVVVNRRLHMTVHLYNENYPWTGNGSEMIGVTDDQGWE